MSSVIENIERAQLRRVPNFGPGDRVKVHFQVIEGARRRVQVFEGVVIKRQGHGARETFTVRKQSFGVGVERSFPVHSPKIERVELAARGDVRRAKLYYLRDRVGKRARVRERRYLGPEDSVEPGLVADVGSVPAAGATDAEGMTAEEAVMNEDSPSPQEAPTTSEDGGLEPAATSGGGEGSAEGELEAVSETSASAAGDAQHSSDPGVEERGVHTGDEPA